MNGDLDRTEETISQRSFQVVYFVRSPAPSRDDRTLDFVFIVIRSEHLRETCCFVECCTLRLMQVSLGGMTLIACLCHKKGPFEAFFLCSFFKLVSVDA